MSLGNIAPEIDLKQVDSSDGLRKALDIEPIDFLNFITAIHHRFNVEMPEIDYPKLTTLKGAVSYLTSKFQNP